VSWAQQLRQGEGEFLALSGVSSGCQKIARLIPHVDGAVLLSPNDTHATVSAYVDRIPGVREAIESMDPDESAPSQLPWKVCARFIQDVLKDNGPWDILDGHRGPNARIAQVCTVPTLAVFGERDKMLAPDLRSHVEAFQTAPNVEIVTLAGAGHLFPGNEAIVADHAADFVDRIKRSLENEQSPVTSVEIDPTSQTLN
jgi:pimeloyl-ACP methyl ester carboxylesterase